tara:strand:- start:1197 stop:3689 length:2493 start_codon:yes stop_codon:yes gene_type:complete
MLKAKDLVIVESPAKARTISSYLGSDYDVAASVGHVRDLPKKELGVDVDDGFEPKYVTIQGKGKIIKELKGKAKKASNIILATDPDREGEAIAYHVAHQLGIEENEGRFQRVNFWEITKKSVQQALENPGQLDMHKVEAQQARRILDRLVGYQVSPFLWKPIRPGLSAGRVQTVALRLICEREGEIQAFDSTEYWSVTAVLHEMDDSTQVADGRSYEAKLHKIDGSSFTLGNEELAGEVVREVKKLDFRVTHVKRRERRKNPTPPFTTSTLQQEAAKRFGFSARRTMTIAQRLFEGVELGKRGPVGLITYIRTDSTRVSDEAINQARTWVQENIGDEYLPDKPRRWPGKRQKSAQEAHEAVRPTDVAEHPNDIKSFLGHDEARLYDLIWLRFVASQMSSAIHDTTTVDFHLKGASGREYIFRSTGSIVKFQGFTRLYLEATEDGEHRRLDDLDPLPDLNIGDQAALEAINPKQHFTQPPPRFSEASLVRELEKLGVGRPSTYAQIISTIQDRGYVDLEAKRFCPTPLGDTVSQLLSRVFPNIFDVDFTSKMENELDRVEEGDLQWQALLGKFYPPFQIQLEQGKSRTEEIVKEILAVVGETCDVCGRPMQVRWNRFGRFLGCSGYPDCTGTRPLDGPAEEIVLDSGKDTGMPILVKVGPYGPYVQLGDGKDSEKPKRVSLAKDKNIEDVELDEALRLLSLPRSLGIDPVSGEEVVAGIGRYGPFVRRGKKFASLSKEDHVFTVDIEEAVQLLNQKKPGRSVLKELGIHPESGAVLEVISGRYGPYVTDGEVNASLGKGKEPEDLTIDEAVELLIQAAIRKKSGSRRRRKN